MTAILGTPDVPLHPLARRRFGTDRRPDPAGSRSAAAGTGGVTSAGDRSAGLGSTWETLLAAHREAAPGGTGHPSPHRPVAAILSCSDARVPPSVIFDQPAGSLFVVRIAGNTATPAAVASLDYAVSELGVDLIVVVGHTNCGAVTAAVDGTCGGHLTPIVARICEIARTNPNLDPDRVARLNVAATVAALGGHDGPVGHAVSNGTVEIRGAIHDLRSGQLTPIAADDQSRPNTTAPPTTTPNPPQLQAP